MEKLSFRQIECFLEVCRDMHFSRAARRLGMAQPPLSRHIKELEEAIGAQLFARENRSVSLTVSGQAFLNEVYRLPGFLSRAVEMARRASSGETEVLRIGFVGAILGDRLLEIFQKYRSLHADTQLHLQDMSPAELLQSVNNGEIDGAFLGIRPKRIAAHVKCFEGREEPLQVCLPLGHPLASRKRLSMEDLQNERLITLSSRVAPAYREFVEDLFRNHSVRPRSVQETNGAQAMLSMVVAGSGIALLPISALQNAKGKIAIVSLSARDHKIQEVFLYSKESSLALQRFVAVIA